MMQSLGVMAQSKKPNTNSSEANSPKIDTEILARHRRSEAHRPAEIDANAITYPAESVKQNFLRPPTSISTLIDNSPVKEKSTIESAISPENNSFGLEYILESFKPIEFCINKPKPYDFCFSVERIFRNTKANFDILDKFNISMSINDIVKQCKYKGRDSNSNPLFNCDNEKIGNNGFITLAIIYYPKVKEALQKSS